MKLSSIRTALVCVVTLPLLTGTTAWAQCDTLPQRRLVDFDSVAVFDYSGGSDCWGWIAPDNTEYAIYGVSNGIAFINLTTMVEADFRTGPTCIWRDIKTYRHYAYEVSECGPGMRIWDMSYLPDSVHLVANFTNGSTRSHNLSIDTAKGFAYLVRQNYSGFRVLNLANPESPSELTGVTTGDLHDVFARNDTVWAAEGDDHAYSVWNLSNKAAPQQMAQITVPGNGYVHNIWPTHDAGFVATTEETVGKTIKIWNTQDLGDISLVSQVLAPSSLAHNAHVEGDYVFLSHYESGIYIWDISYPQCPVLVAAYDNYPSGEAGDYNGCWGVYPHAGTGRIYASTIEGGLWVFDFTVHPYAASAQFSGTPRIGEAPLEASFSSNGLDLNNWSWNFGDGGSSADQNPIHSYTAPGVYDVSLAVAGPAGTDSLFEPAYVIALAETLHVADTGFDRGTQVVWDFNLQNGVPLEEIRLPISISGIPGMATFDSVTYDGCRTSYFEQKQLVYDDRPDGEVVLLLRADAGGMSPDLTPGNGPIARLHLTILPGAIPGESITLSTPQIGFHILNAKTAGMSYAPAYSQGSAVIGPPCDCSCHADPFCDGAPNIQDVISTIAVAFRGNAPTIDPACVHAGRSDVNCSGATDVVDVVAIIGAAFRGEDPQTSFCDPCN